MSLLRNVFLFVEKRPCGHVTAQKCNFLGTKKPLRACYCSEMQFFRYKNTLAGMSLLRNTFLHTKQAPAGSEIHFLGTNKNCGHVTAQQCNFRYKKNNCGHVTAQKCNFLGTKKPCGHVTAHKCYFWYKQNLRACYCSEI